MINLISKLTIMEIPSNFYAIALVVFINFIIGWLWYGPLFGKAWALEMKMDMSKVPEKGVVIKGMLLMLLGNFLMAYVISHDIFAWSKVPGMEKMDEAGMGPIFATAFFTWIGFYVPTHIGATTWEGKSWKLTFINLAYHFVTLFAAAFILIKMGW
jgi:hypothetical protein